MQESHRWATKSECEQATSKPKFGNICHTMLQCKEPDRDNETRVPACHNAHKSRKNLLGHPARGEPLASSSTNHSNIVEPCDDAYSILSNRTVAYHGAWFG